MTQSQALSILKTGANVFLTGEPGSGKTYVINEYVAYLRGCGIEPAVTASTGIAATHINGMTIHSWSGVGIKTKLDKRDLNKISASQYIAKRVRRTKVLIIEEVSMLLPEMLSMVDAVCREIKQSSKPFGGMQVVFSGDFFQLPPVVVKTQDKATGFALAEGASFALAEGASFAYNSPTWIEANPIVCYLTEQYRQDDPNYLAILSAIRRNAFDNDYLRQIETRKIERHAAPSNTPKLFAHNADVDRINGEILAKLSGEPREFRMFSEGPDALVIVLKKGCLSPETLFLKVGAAVMFTKNNPKDGFANGTLGTVEGFNKTNSYPFVRTRNEQRIEVEPMNWTMEENGKVRAQISQLPLRLAWAITVHKSQGMNLDEAVVDLSDVFEFGQGYVALSRVRRLSGLYILGWNDRAFQVHPGILAKDEAFRVASRDAETVFSTIPPAELQKRHDDFINFCGGKNISGSANGLPEVSSALHATSASGSIRRERRWERTLAFIRSGKSIAEVAKMRSRTKGTILEHLECLCTLGKLSRQDIAHLARGSEQSIAKIHNAFRELGTDKLSPVFEKFGGRYSYDELRIARLFINKKFTPAIPIQFKRFGFEKIRETYPNAYRPWNKEQNEKLRELFAKGSAVASLAKTFGRKGGAIRSRLVKLGLLEKR